MPGFMIVCAFFLAEYVLRLIAAPEAPGGEHRGRWRSRLAWATSLGGIFDLLGALPGVLDRRCSGPAYASLFGFVWAFKYVRYSPGLASLGRVISNARQALLSVLLGFCIVLLTAASLAYLLERNAHPDHPEAFASIPAALWWAHRDDDHDRLRRHRAADRRRPGAGRRRHGQRHPVFALWTGILVNGYAEELRRREFLRTWELVAKVPFFHNIGASLIADVARLLRPRDYPAGAVIVRRGEPGDCMYFVVDGEVEIQLQPEPLYLGAGEFFGELALLTGDPRNATVVAVQALHAAGARHRRFPRAARPPARTGARHPRGGEEAAPAPTSPPAAGPRLPMEGAIEPRDGRIGLISGRGRHDTAPSG